jgi:hypothetical protein
MGYYWTATPALTEDAAAALGLEVEFDDQAQAEAWLTSSYEVLAEAGVHQVSLCEAGRLVYGPMSLDA